MQRLSVHNQAGRLKALPVSTGGKTNTMRKFLYVTLIAASLQAFPAYAEWTSIHKDKSTEILVDWATFNFDKKIASIWFVQDFERERNSSEWKNIQSIQSFAYFDCKSEKYYEPITLLFSGKGNSRQIVGRLTFDVPPEMFEWKMIDDWQAASLTWAEVCAPDKTSK